MLVAVILSQNPEQRDMASCTLLRRRTTGGADADAKLLEKCVFGKGKMPSLIALGWKILSEQISSIMWFSYWKLALYAANQLQIMVT